jgi:F-type H+-transporting ATPase subunit b
MALLQSPEFWVAIGFAAAIATLLRAGAIKFTAKYLDNRAAIIAAELAQAKRLREEAETLLADYRAKADAAEKEAQTIVTDARAEAVRFAEEARATLQAQIERRAQAAQEKIAQAEAAALHEIRALAADAAVAAAEKLIAARMDEKRSGKLIEAGIQELGAKLN